jgi:hypothetical protein
MLARLRRLMREDPEIIEKLEKTGLRLHKRELLPVLLPHRSAELFDVLVGDGHEAILA